MRSPKESCDSETFSNYCRLKMLWSNSNGSNSKMSFENALVEFDLTGAQVMTLLKQVVSHRDAQSGARIKYVNSADNRPELENARLLIDGRETEIDLAATYKIVCIDYLWKRTSNVPSETEGNYSVLGQAKKI